MDLTPLTEELRKPEYAGKSDQEAADMVNAKTVQIRQEVPTWQLKRHAIESGYWAASRSRMTTYDRMHRILGIVLRLFLSGDAYGYPGIHSRSKN